MSQRMKLFILILVINIVMVLVYLIWNHLRKKEKVLSTWMKAAVMLLCPLVGPAFVFLSYLFYKLVMSQNMDLSDVVFGKEKTRAFIRPDEEVEKNMISIEDALEIADKKSLRTFIMNVIRGDYRNSLASLALALNSEDSETAHYAGSVLQDVLSDFRSQVQEKYVRSQVEDEEQAENCISLVEYMLPIIVQKVLTNMEQHAMIARMDEVLEKAWTLDRRKISSVLYEKMCQCLLDIQDYKTCEKWCVRSMEQYPAALSSYTSELKLFFSCGDKEKFFDVMKRLRASDITIDSETLELIRTFM